MATNETNGANGELELYYKFYESGSGHIENSERKVLKAKNDDMIHLIEDSSHMEPLNRIKSRNYNNKTIYQISVNELIALIKEHGEKID